jgi:uncharacterized lipoprotein YddW (UPF0748 family)
LHAKSSTLQKLKTRIVFLMSLACLCLQAQKHEVRAVWLSTIGGIDWPRSFTISTQKRELCNILDQLKRINVNTVLIQTRVRASTIYPSSIEPFDMCMTGRHGRSPGYDPLAFAVNECHKRGMECHAWIVTLPIGKTNESRFKDFRKRHPSLIRTIGSEGFMNPENPATGDYLACICAEVTDRYDIDGVHLDYIRYPEKWKLRIPHQQARRNITDIVRKIHHAVKEIKPWVKISCAPIGKFNDLSRYRSGGWNAFTAVSQDAQGWLREGLMDQLYPMMYFRGNDFYPFALDWQEHTYGRTVVPGLGIYFLSPKEGKWLLGDVTRELYFLRNNSLGHCFFRSDFLTRNTRGIYSFMESFNDAPALIPPMTWQWDQKPTAPTQVNVLRSRENDRLSWAGAEDTSNAPYLLYNVYAAPFPEVNTEEPRNLVVTRFMGSSLTIPHSNNRHLCYAVTAIDRYGNESAPIYSDHSSNSVATHQQKILSPLGTKIPPFYYLMTKKEQRKIR